MPEINDTTEDTASPLASAPMFAPIDPYDDPDVSYAIEGSPEADAAAAEAPAGTPTSAGGGTDVDDLKAQLAAMKAQMEQSVGAGAVGKGLEEALKRYAPQPAPMMAQQPVETDDQRQARLQRLFIEDPIKATTELNKSRDAAYLQLLINNNQTLSKELVVANPETKGLYEKYRDEVEQEVARMAPADKAQNPRVYQTALERVKGNHSTELLAEQIKAGVAEALKQMGIDPANPPTTGGTRGGPVVPSAAGQQRVANGPTGAPQGVKKTMVIPKWVAERASREGLDPKFLYNHLKSKGQVK